jgi:hypothetical protein
VRLPDADPIFSGRTEFDHVPDKLPRWGRVVQSRTLVILFCGRLLSSSHARYPLQCVRPYSQPTARTSGETEVVLLPVEFFGHSVWIPTSTVDLKQSDQKVLSLSAIVSGFCLTLQSFHYTGGTRDLRCRLRATPVVLSARTSPGSQVCALVPRFLCVVIS